MAQKPSRYKQKQKCIISKLGLPFRPPLSRSLSLSGKGRESVEERDFLCVSDLGRERMRENRPFVSSCSSSSSGSGRQTLTFLLILPERSLSPPSDTFLYTRKKEGEGDVRYPCRGHATVQYKKARRDVEMRTLPSSFRLPTCLLCTIVCLPYMYAYTYVHIVRLPLFVGAIHACVYCRIYSTTFKTAFFINMS